MPRTLVGYRFGVGLSAAEDARHMIRSRQLAK
jgi:hypothetical protein